MCSWNIFTHTFTFTLPQGFYLKKQLFKLFSFSIGVEDFPAVFFIFETQLFKVLNHAVTLCLLSEGRIRNCGCLQNHQRGRQWHSSTRVWWAYPPAEQYVLRSMKRRVFWNSELQNVELLKWWTLLQSKKLKLQASTSNNSTLLADLSFSLNSWIGAGSMLNLCVGLWTSYNFNIYVSWWNNS